MTPASVLNTSVSGYWWARDNRGGSSSRRELFPASEQENLDPKSLQAVIIHDEPFLELLQSGREQTESQVTTVSSFHQSRRLRVREAENIPQPEVATLSEAAIQILGENGQRRFQEFRQYQPGWNVGQGAPLSIRSATVLDKFLTQLPDLVAYQPSLFLTHDGNLELGWEDSNGDAMEIEFWPDRVSYYFEGLDQERTVRLEVFPQFIERIRSLIS